VQDAVDRYYHLSNEAPTYLHVANPLTKEENLCEENWLTLPEFLMKRSQSIAIPLRHSARLPGASIMQKGDEIVMTKQDYPNMIHAWKQRELREGVKINWINLNLPVDNDEVVLKAYIDATTSKTKSGTSPI